MRTTFDFNLTEKPIGRYFIEKVQVAKALKVWRISIRPLPYAAMSIATNSELAVSVFRIEKNKSSVNDLERLGTIK
jgi:hypothetical protein